MASRVDFPFALDSLAQPANEFVVPPCDDVYSLGLGLTSRCNFSCPICYYHSQGKAEYTDFPLALLRQLFADMPRLVNVNIALEGEPLCYPDLFAAMDLIATHTQAFSFASNGSLLTPSIIARLQDYHYTLFALSIDAADAQNYARLRKGGSLTTFLRHAATLRQALGSCVTFNAVLFAQNLDSICQLPRLAAQVGVQKIGLMQLREHSYCLKHGLHKADTLALRNCLETLCVEADKYHIQFLVDEYFAQETIMRFVHTQPQFVVLQKHYEHLFCMLPWSYTSLLANGRLFPCCGDFQAASVQHYSFDGLFNHKYLRVLRGLIAAKKNPRPCQICRNRKDDHAVQ